MEIVISSSEIKNIHHQLCMFIFTCVCTHAETLLREISSFPFWMDREHKIYFICELHLCILLLMSFQLVFVWNKLARKNLLMGIKRKFIWFRMKVCYKFCFGFINEIFELIYLFRIDHVSYEACIYDITCVFVF